MDKIVITLITACIGYEIGKKLKLPAPAMIGSMLLVGNHEYCFWLCLFSKT